jgi:hypothetical protein
MPAQTQQSGVLHPILSCTGDFRNGMGITNCDG